MSNENDKEYSSYDDYLQQAQNEVIEISKETYENQQNSYDYTSSQDPLITGDADSVDTGSASPDVRSNDAIEESTSRGVPNGSPVNGSDVAPKKQSVLLEGSTTEGVTEGVTDAAGAIGESTGGLLNAAKTGLGNAMSGAWGALTSGLKGLFGKGQAKITGIASSLNVSVRAVMLVAGVAGGGSVLSLLLLLFGNNQIRYEDEANCNLMEMIQEYEAKNGSGDNWTEKSAQGSGRTIHSALSSVLPWEFDTWEWTEAETTTTGAVGTWVETTKTNEGFGFSDEVIAGMLSNAYAESKIRSDCYEMDYLVHDVSAKDDSGNYKFGPVKSYNTIAEYAANKESDLVLGRTHHSNWDNYCKRMFELYAGAGMGINEAAYVWRSDYTGPGAVHGRTNIAGLSGLYPGVGLWQWTGQRAYNLSRFADIQTNPNDTDQDGVNDTMYGIDCQLAFLYYEDWGSFKKDENGDPLLEATYDGTSDYTREYDTEDDAGNKIHKSVTFESGHGYGVLSWGRQNSFKYTGTLGHNDGLAYHNLSFPAYDNYVGEDTARNAGTVGAGGEYVHDKDDEYGENINLEANEDMYSGQIEPTLDDDRDVWNSDKEGGDEETTIRWPKFIIVSNDDHSNIGGNFRTTDHDEMAPPGYLSTEDYVDVSALPQYLTNAGAGSDNRVEGWFYLGTDEPSEAELNGPGYHIEYDTLATEGEDDTGYWSSTSNSDMLDTETTYLNNLQSMEAAGGAPADDETRKDTTVRIGRKFNEKELDMFEHLYTVNVRLETKVESEWDSVNRQWVDVTKYYRVVSLDFADGDVDMGYDSHVAQLRKKMSNPNGKYIAADVRICAGAESAVEAARQFALFWEGVPADNSAMLVSHMAKAGSFYILMQTDGWETNEAYAHSILEMIDDNRNNHEIVDLRKSYTDMGCDPAGQAPDGIAACAVSWAWPAGTTWYDIDLHIMDGGGDCYKLTKCTSLYCKVKDVIVHEVENKSDHFYSSCDRGVCTAVKAAGADDNFPWGACVQILAYCNENSSGEWEALGHIGPGSADILEPGDILVSKEHVMVFVGPDLPLEKWPGGAGKLSDCTYAVVHSSRSGNITNSRGPRCDNDVRLMLSNNVWYAFRHNGPMNENSPKKKAAEIVFQMGYFDGRDASTGQSYTPLD